MSIFPEIEAAEACKWLRAAGFPQYAQMYEGKQYATCVKQIQFYKCEVCLSFIL